MSDQAGTSRRTFIGTAGAAVAVAGVATAIPGFASTPAAALKQSVVVSVVDPAKGVFNVMFGETSVEVTDKAFASKLASLVA